MDVLGFLLLFDDFLLAIRHSNRSTLAREPSRRPAVFSLASDSLSHPSLPSIATFVLPYGLLGGLGFGFLYTSSLVIVSNHWRRRGYGPLANGITTSGMGGGTAAFGPISYAIIKRFRWRWYLRIFGFCFLGTSALTFIVYRIIKGEESEGGRQRRRIFDRSLLRFPPSFSIFLA